MVISLPGGVRHDDLHAAVSGVVCPLALLPVAVSHVVRIRLLKLCK